MDYTNIVFTIELDDDGAKDDVNTYLKDGWLLISVGPKLVNILDNGQAYYNTAYVVGATKEQYEKYQNESKSFDLESFIQ